jgi:cyclophilin family peptidyl-prolyl cis-trans isomerase
MKRLILAALGLFAALTVRADTPSLPDGLYAAFTVPAGRIVCQLDYQRAPLTCVNFVGLAEGTLGPAPKKPFFDGLKFHRVVPDFVIQGGDPLNTGEGGPGYMFPDEFSPELRHDKTGTLSMANDGPDTNGSQFFITLRETNRLNFLHSVFGKTVQGLEVLPKVKQGDTMKVEILRIGAAAQAFKADQTTFDALKKKAIVYAGPPLPGPKADFDDPAKLLPEDPPRAKIFNFKLANVERATGVKIRVRLVAHFTPSNEAPSASTETHLLATQLGYDKDAVLAVYYADLDFWDIWIGSDQIGPFVGLPGTTADLMATGALHRTKHQLIDQAHVQAILFTQEAEKALPKGTAMLPGNRIKYGVDAMVGALIDKLTQ